MVSSFIIPLMPILYELFNLDKDNPQMIGFYKKSKGLVLQNLVTKFTRKAIFHL